VLCGSTNHRGELEIKIEAQNCRVHTRKQDPRHETELHFFRSKLDSQDMNEFHVLPKS